MVMATHDFVAVAPPHGGASPFVTISSPQIGVTAVAPKPLGTASVLRVLTPVVRVCSSSVVGIGSGIYGTSGPRKQQPGQLEGPYREKRLFRVPIYYFSVLSGYLGAVTRRKKRRKAQSPGGIKKKKKN